jgi:Phosphotransferase enzyme family
MTMPTPAESITPDSLTLALRRSGALGHGRVSAVEAEQPRSTILSRIVRLRLAYEGEAEGGPQTLIFKTGLPERMSGGRNGGRQEVAFYRYVAAETPPGLLPRCYGAEWDEATNHWFLLLEDLSQSHRIVTTWPLPPSFVECEAILAARARFHAHWWDDPRLGATVGRWVDAAAVEEFLNRLAGKISSFSDRMGDRLPKERKDLYERLIDRGPDLLKRALGGPAATIVHGDAHVWNCFIPKDGGADIRLFDWDTWRLGIAAEDLAYMMAVHWYPDRRRLMEQPLLDRYHLAIEAHGVKAYDRRALDDDYRLSTLWSVTTPVFQAEGGIPAVIWWNNFERIWLAVDDLGARELLS